VRAEIHVPLDVHRHVAAKVALDLVLLIDDLADLHHLVVAQIIALLVLVDPGLAEDLVGQRAPDPEQVRQRHLHPLVAREVDSSDTRHLRLLALPLLVAGGFSLPPPPPPAAGGLSIPSHPSFPSPCPPPSPPPPPPPPPPP